MSFYIPGCRIVGVDIGSRFIKSVRITTSFTNFSITGFMAKEHHVDTWKDLSKELESLAKERAMRGDLIIASFPSTHVLFRNTEMPFSQIDKVESTIRFEAESVMAIPMEGMIVDFILLGQGVNGSSVLIACVKEALLQEYIDALLQGGIVPDTIDIDSLALARLVAELKEERNIGLLDIGAEKISVSTFQNGRLQTTRSIPLGDTDGDTIEGIKPALDEMIFTLKTYQGAGTGIAAYDDIWITGGGSRRDGFDDYVKKILGAPVSYPNFFERFPSSITLPNEASFLGGVALGLALRGLRMERDRIDLATTIPTAVQPITPLLRRRILYMSMIIILLMALIATNFYLAISAKERRYTMLKGEIRKTFSTTFPDVKGVVNELQQAHEMVKVMGERGVAIGLRNDGSPLEILREISQRLPQDTKIIELDMDGERVALQGIAPSFAVVDEVKSALAASSFFSDVKVGTVEIARKGEKGVVFAMILEREKR